MPTVSEILNSINEPPIFDQGELEIERGQIRVNRALEKALLLRDIKQRLVPGVLQEQRGRNAFWSGATTRKIQEGAEDRIIDYLRTVPGDESAISAINRNMFKIGLGIRI